MDDRASIPAGAVKVIFFFAIAFSLIEWVPGALYRKGKAAGS
jgi:hypothetical protein